MTVKSGSIGMFLSAALCASSACDANRSLPKLGNYQGNLILSSASGPSSDASLQKYAVTAEFSRPDPASIHLEMKGNPALNASNSLDITLDHEGRKAALNIPGTVIQSQELD